MSAHTHNVVHKDGSIKRMAFPGMAGVLAYGRKHRRTVETIETLRGTVEYGLTEDGTFVGGWDMPEWMEPFRALISTGGNPVEDLMNDQRTTVFANAPRAMLCVSTKDQVALLVQLHEQGALVAPDEVRNEGA